MSERLSVTVRCVTAEHVVLGSTSVAVDVIRGRCYPRDRVVVPIDVNGEVDGAEACVLDQWVSLPLTHPPVAVHTGDYVTLDFGECPMLQMHV